MTIHDYGTPTDTLASPSLSEWAAAVAAAIDGTTPTVGAAMHCMTAVPSSTTASTALTSTAQVGWGGVTFGTGIIVPAAGWYRVTVAGAFNNPGTAGTIRALWVWTAAGAIPTGGQNPIGTVTPPVPNAGTLLHMLNATGVWLLAAGDHLRPYARHDAGTAYNTWATLNVDLVRAT